jgi:hypothetical protein
MTNDFDARRLVGPLPVGGVDGRAPRERGIEGVSAAARHEPQLVEGPPHCQCPRVSR